MDRLLYKPNGERRHLVRKLVGPAMVAILAAGCSSSSAQTSGNTGVTTSARSESTRTEATKGPTTPTIADTDPATTPTVASETQPPNVNTTAAKTAPGNTIVPLKIFADQVLKYTPKKVGPHMTGHGVVTLQHYLNLDGCGVAATGKAIAEDDNYGSGTFSTVSEFGKNHQLDTGTDGSVDGAFQFALEAAINAHEVNCGGSAGAPANTTDATLAQAESNPILPTPGAVPITAVTQSISTT